jgi:drug/metabolite transporter (DMT)-like permease
MRHYFSETPSSVQGGPFLLFAAICFVLHLAMGAPTTRITETQWIYIGLFGIIPIAYALWEHGVKQGNIRLLALTSYFIPFLSAIWIALAMGTSLSTNLLLGGLCIIASPILASYGPRLWQRLIPPRAQSELS